RRHTRWPRDWSSDVCSSDLAFAFSSLRFSNGRTAMLLSGAAEMVGVRFSHKRNPITIRATTAPIFAHFGIVDFGRPSFAAGTARSEERRVGKGCSRWVPAEQ